MYKLTLHPAFTTLGLPIQPFFFPFLNEYI